MEFDRGLKFRKRKSMHENQHIALKQMLKICVHFLSPKDKGLFMFKLLLITFIGNYAGSAIVGQLRGALEALSLYVGYKILLFFTQHTEVRVDNSR